MTVFCCQGDQGPIGPPGRPGDNGDPVSITCTSTEVASNCKYTQEKKVQSCHWDGTLKYKCLKVHVYTLFPLNETYY